MIRFTYKPLLAIVQAVSLVVAPQAMPQESAAVYRHLAEEKPRVLAFSALEIKEPQIKEEKISEKIIGYANVFGVDSNLALNVACAESCARDKEGNVYFNPKAKNPNSTASGIFQFVKGTWEESCQGDVFNENDNIRCGVKLLAKEGGIRHWEASRKEGFGGGWENKPYEKFNVIN